MSPAATATFKENIEFNVLLDVGDFEQGRQACQDLDPPAELASFASLEEYNFILETIGTIDEPIEFLWIGLQRDSDDDLTEAEDIADSFEFLDGTPNVITETPFVFPWASDEPVNSNSIQLCAAISIDFDSGESQTLDDQRCDRNDGDVGAVCKIYLSDSATQVASDGSYQITVVTLPEDARTFDDGINFCAALDPPGALASFTNEDEFNFILDTIHLVPPVQLAWVGLKRDSDEGVEASDFEFLDETSNEFTSVGNQFPWADEEPNNFEGIQECGSVAYTFEEPNRLEDFSCSGEGFDVIIVAAVCKQIVTEMPTISPTKLPTSSPTKSPTLNPTISPTLGPTVSPTPSPTVDAASQGIRNTEESIFFFVSGGAMFILTFALLFILLKENQKKDVINKQLSYLGDKRVESLL